MAERIHRVRTPRGRMQIFVKTIAGNEMTFDAKLSDTIKSLKAKIHTATGHAIYKQRLIFEDTVLEDGSKLSDYNIQNADSLTLVISRSFTVLIKPPRGRRFPLVVNPTDLVDDLRVRIAEHFDEFQVADYLTIRQLGRGYLENGRTLSDYNIQDRDVLHFFIPAAFEGFID